LLVRDERLLALRPAARIAQSINMARGHPGFSRVVRSAD
jgi:hypothetical protein